MRGSKVTSEVNSLFHQPPRHGATFVPSLSSLQPPPTAMDVSESSTASEDKLYGGEALAEAGEEGTSSGLVHLIPSPNQVDKQPMIARERSKGPRAVTYEEDLADKKAAVQLAHHTAIDVEALEGIRSGSFSARPASARTPSSRPWRSSSSGTASRRSTSRPLPPPGGHSSARLQPSSGDITVLQTWSTLDAGLFAFDMGVMVGILPQIKGVIRSWETAPKVAFGVTAGMAVGLLAMGLMTAKYRLDPKNRLGKLSAFCARFSTLLSTALFIVTTACEFGSIGCKAGAIYAAVVVIIMIGFWVYEELSAEGGVSNFWSRGKPAAAAQTVQRTSSHTETKP